jgi:hypothetical protein
MRADIQIITAALLGTAAYKNGNKCIPAQDAELLEMFRGREIGETPEGEASTIHLLKIWQKAWHEANLSA